MQALLDANLLVLLVVGLVQPERVATHRRTRGFSLLDHELLQAALEHADVVLAPGVIAEASNLLRYDDPDGLLGRGLALVCGEAIERHVPVAVAMRRREYAWLGYTDAVLLAAWRTGDLLITNDGRLFDAAMSAGVDAEHFELLRARPVI